MNVDKLAAVVDDLIEVLHLQARELENLITHVEQVTVHLPEESEMSVIRSSLTGLHQQIKKLRGTDHPLP
jgi:polyhydroxyalkanoate synthesis regulator phasin